MAHFAVITPPVSGHLNPLCALGRELQTRGHKITVFHMPDIEEKILKEGLNFKSIGASDHPLGSLPKSLARMSQLSGLEALRFAIAAICKTTEMLLRDAPKAMQAEGIEAVIVDQTEPVGATIAEHLGLPYVTVCCALILNREPDIPPPFTAWDYQTSWWHRLRNRVGYSLFDLLTRQVLACINQARKDWHLTPYTSAEDSYSPRLQISQQPQIFDFPRTTLPDSFHYLGPFRNSSPREVSFPYDQLNGKPLIYASLGTQQNQREELFSIIAAACIGLEAQLVLTHGGGLSDEAVARLPGSHIVVSYAPQVELLSKAHLTICHAGLNTVLDSLSHAVPVVTIPITYEQPAIANRLQWLGAGLKTSLDGLTPESLRQAITTIMTDGCYRAKASTVAQGISEAGGVSAAAILIEHAITPTTI